MVTEYSLKCLLQNMLYNCSWNTSNAKSRSTIMLKKAFRINFGGFKWKIIAIHVYQFTCHAGLFVELCSLFSWLKQSHQTSSQKFTHYIYHAHYHVWLKQLQKLVREFLFRFVSILVTRTKQCSTKNICSSWINILKKK